MLPIDSAATAGDTGSPASHGVANHQADKEDYGGNANDFAALRAMQQLEEQAQILQVEVSEISRRLIGIRQQLVTISDKTSTSTAAVVGNEVSEEDILMAREAQAIMRRMGEIKGRLSSISRKKKKYQALMSPSSSFQNMNDVSVGSSSLGLPSMDGFSETFLYTKHDNPPSQGTAPALQKPTALSGIPSVLPGAVSLGSTPCMASSSPMTHYPGGFLHQDPSDESKLSCPSFRQEREQFLEMEQRDGVPSPVRLEESKSFSSFPEHPPKVVPWGVGIPGRVDHGIGVIGSRRKSMVPSLDPIASFSTSATTSANSSSNEDDNVRDISMSSQLSPILTDEESSVNAFDYPLVKPEATLNPLMVSTGAASISNHTTSLFDDALMDTSSIEGPFEGTMVGEAPSAKRTSSPNQQNCGQETILDVLFCRAMDSATPFLEKNGEQPRTSKKSVSGGLCGFHQGEGKEYSLESFLKEAWI